MSEDVQSTQVIGIQLLQNFAFMFCFHLLKEHSVQFVYFVHSGLIPEYVINVLLLVDEKCSVNTKVPLLMFVIA